MKSWASQRSSRVGGRARSPLGPANAAVRRRTRCTALERERERAQGHVQLLPTYSSGWAAPRAR
eukprot:14384762-Alexandrium_andersonii.AAC.1